jgi:antitoxin CptB
VCGIQLESPLPAPSGFLALEQSLSGSAISSSGMDGQRRRLLFRLRHRGIREMDLVLGRFAEARLVELSDAELGEVEIWLDIPDQQIFAWVNGSEPAPPQIDTALFRELRQFHRLPDCP